MTIPCIDCLCMPVCKNKGFWRMIKDCSILKTFVLGKEEIAYNELTSYHKKKYWRRKFALKEYFKPKTDEQLAGWHIKHDALNKRPM